VIHCTGSVKTERLHPAKGEPADKSVFSLLLCYSPDTLSSFVSPRFSREQFIYRSIFTRKLIL